MKTIAAAIGTALLIAGCSNPQAAQHDAAPAPEPTVPDPTASCETCFARVCGPCLSPECIPERKTSACELYRTAMGNAVSQKSSPQEQRATCEKILSECDEAVAAVESDARPPTPEDEPLEFARFRIEKTTATHPDAKLRRRDLLCEVLAKIDTQAREERVDSRMLETRPKRYVGSPIVLRGRVFQVFDREETQESAFLISLGRTNVYVEYPEETDIVNRQGVRVYGYVSGDYSYTSVAGWEITVPRVAALVVAGETEMNHFFAYGGCPRVELPTAVAEVAPPSVTDPVLQPRRVVLSTNVPARFLIDGRSIGQGRSKTFDGVVLPFAVRVEADGYEPQDVTIDEGSQPWVEREKVLVHEHPTIELERAR